jgi:hypothetical protein
MKPCEDVNLADVRIVRDVTKDLQPILHLGMEFLALLHVLALPYQPFLQSDSIQIRSR